MKRPIENNSSPGQAVYEPFCGSGTTIIAAEMTGRVLPCHRAQPGLCRCRGPALAGLHRREGGPGGDGRSFAEVAGERRAAADEAHSAAADATAAPAPPTDADRRAGGRRPMTAIDVRLRAEWVENVGYRYDVLLDGEVIVRRSRDPEHDAARALHARGLRGRFRTIDFSTGRPRMILDIEKAARLRTVERDDRRLPIVVPYRPMSDERQDPRQATPRTRTALPRQGGLRCRKPVDGAGGESVRKARRRRRRSTARACPAVAVARTPDMGRARTSPIPASRRQVEAMAGYGVPEADIAGVLAIDPKTLRKHYRDELDTGPHQGERQGGREPLPQGDRRGPQSVIAAIFWLKTRAGWKETSVTELAARDQQPVLIVRTIRDPRAEQGGPISPATDPLGRRVITLTPDDVKVLRWAAARTSRTPSTAARSRRWPATAFPRPTIARVVGIDAKTLRKHYREELDTGQIKATAKVAESLFRKATGDGSQSVTAAIFWLKTRGGWRETPQDHRVGHYDVTTALRRGTGAADHRASGRDCRPDHQGVNSKLRSSKNPADWCGTVPGTKQGQTLKWPSRPRRQPR